MRKSLLLSCVLCITSVVHAFSVIIGNPTQCDDLSVSWNGGQAPFEILVAPFSPEQALRNISVPASAFGNGKGSYSTSQLPLQNGSQFLLTMSDATGFGSGGTSTILNVGAPIANNNCNTTVLSPDFYFTTPLELQQCNNYVFDAYEGANLPATITALIPGGEYVILSPVTGPNYTWVADVLAGTDLVFFMIDSQGRQGGVSPLNTVQPLANTSCLNVNSPSSTAASAPSQTSSQSPSPGSNTATVGIIAGAAVGGVVVFALLIILGIWCIRKAPRRSGRTDDGDKVVQNLPSQHQMTYGSDLLLMQPGSYSHLSTGDRPQFSQNLRQISHTDSFTRSSSIPSASRQMGSSTASPNTFPHQTLPVGLSPPVHPGTYSHQINDSVGSSAFNDHYASSFGQTQPRLSANTDAGNSSVSSSRLASTSHIYSFPYQTSAAPLTQPGGLSHQTSASRFLISDPSSQTSPSHMSSVTHADTESPSIPSTGGRLTTVTGTSAANPSPHFIVHTDIKDIPASPDVQDVIELPPQYTERQLPPS